MSDHAETDAAQAAADNTRAQQENENLRAQLAHERADLEKQLSETRDQASGGLTDDDVRRAEHPEEFSDDGDEADDGEPARVAPVTPAATTGPTFAAGTSGGDAVSTGFAQVPAGIPHPPAGTPPDVDELTLLERLEVQAQQLRQRLFGSTDGGDGS